MSFFPRVVLPILTGGILLGTIATAEAGPLGRWRQRRYQGYSYTPTYQPYGYGPTYSGNTAGGNGGTYDTGYRGIRGVMGGETYNPYTGQYDTSDHNGYYGYGL